MMSEPDYPTGWRGRRSYDCCDGYCGAGDCRRCYPKGDPSNSNDEDGPFEDEPTDVDGAKP